MSIKDNVKLFIGRTGLLAQKHAPEILIGVGIVSIGAGMVTACKATLNANDILEEHKESMDKIHKAKELEPAAYTENMVRQDTAKVYSKTIARFGKLYGPAICFTTVGIAAILYSHKIMTKRVLALGAAYEVVSTQFDNYRKRVAEEFGEDVDRRMRYGIKSEGVEVTSTDENGKEHKSTETINHADDISSYSDYAKFFDDMNPNWNKDPERNLMFLKTQERFANDMLKSRGHVFLNEVYDMLGIPRTQAGAVIGWVWHKDTDPDISFNIYDLYNSAKREFVNGYEPSILLDFNVTGVIWDKI